MEPFPGYIQDDSQAGTNRKIGKASKRTGKRPRTRESVLWLSNKHRNFRPGAAIGAKQYSASGILTGPSKPHELPQSDGSWK
jgi:hypothetical protein